MANRAWLVLYCFLLLAILCIAESPQVLAAEELEANSWTTLPEQEIETLCSVVAVDDKIYCLSFVLKDTWISTVYVYDPQANSWETKTATSDKPWGDGEIQPAQFTTGVVGDSIYFFGHGVYMEGMLNNKVYDTSANHWSSITPDPHSRIDPAACVVNGKIYLIGGSTSSLIETYDPATDTWETKQSLNKPVLDPMAIAIGDKIYVFGAGYIQFYDPQTDQWRTIGELQLNYYCRCAAATTGKYAPQKIYFFSPKVIQIFDPQTETLDNMPYPNHTIPEYITKQYPNAIFGNTLDSFQVAVVNDVFYLIGGSVAGRNQYGSSIESFKVDYRYVPLGYSVSSSSDGDVNSWLFSVAGVVVAVAVLAGAAVVVIRFKHSKPP
ncbi:MAG: hypothetical protein NWF01_02560 [Candidatus Bathyarchaeota archaeon]|nr:hypothetical protein [Candidatus Bathyarchaeota archaeon]